MYLTLSPSKNLNSVDVAGFGRFLKFHNADKLVHACMFFGLAFLYQFLVSKKPLYNYILIPFVISFIIEILQEIMPFGRTFDWFDLLANLTGIILAIIVVQTIKKARS